MAYRPLRSGYPGVVFTESFWSNAAVANNGGTIQGSAEANKGLEFDGNAAYVVYKGASLPPVQG